MTAPRPGDRVSYRLDTRDATDINRFRANFQHHQARAAGHKHPHGRDGWSGAPGYVAHYGNEVRAGQWWFADVVDAGDGDRIGWLNVWAYGTDPYGVRNVPAGDGPGCWRPL